MCKASLVTPKQPLASIPERFDSTAELTIMHCNIIENRPTAAWRVLTLDLTKQKLLRQCIVRHPESMT